MPATASPEPRPEPEPEPKPEATLAETRALAHPLRLRIIRLLYDRSLTNRELARALGEHPATVLHHVRTLLRNGFIAVELVDRAPDDETAVLLGRAQWAELSARYGVPEAEPASINNPGAFRAPSGAFVGLAVAGE